MPKRHFPLYLIALCGYIALSSLMTWPLVAHLSDSLGSGIDPQLQAWILVWDVHALGSNPAGLWQAPIFFPYPNTLAYSDHHLALALLAAPLIWLTHNPVLAYNLLVLLSFVLSGWAVYLLSLDMLGAGDRATRAGQRVDCYSHLAAFIAGVAFSFGSFRMAQFVHLQMLQTCWLAFALLFLRRSLGPHGCWWDVLLLAVFSALQCITALYFAYFTVLTLGLYSLVWLIGAIRPGQAGVERWGPGEPGARRSISADRTTSRLPPSQSSWRMGVVRVLVGALLTGVIVVPLTLPYIEVYRSLGIVRSVRELDNWSAPLQAYLAVAPGSWLYGRMGTMFAARGGEFALFPGGLVVLLALIGMLPYAQDSHGSTPKSQNAKLIQHSTFNIQLFLILLALIAFVLSLGTGLRLTRGADVLPLPLPYALLYERLPGFGALRVPARWGMLVALALCLLAALGLNRLCRRLRPVRRYVLCLVALLLVVIENVVLPMPLVPAPNLAQAAAVYGWLAAAEQRDIDVILELPLGRTPRGAELDRSMLRQYLGILHWKTSPAGYSGLTPFGTLDLLGHIQALPDPQVLRYLQIVGVDTLIIHRNEYEAAALQKLLSGLDHSALLTRRVEIDDVLVYTLLPDPQLNLPGGTRVLITNDERMPGLLSLALIQRWQAAGVQLYGPGRTRYYSALGAVKPGDRFDYMLLVDTENPLYYGLKAMPVWQSNGLALYAHDPSQRVNLNLGSVPAGRFHPAYPAGLEWKLERNSAVIGGQRITWSQALERAQVELDIASLIPQRLRIGDTILDIPAGFSHISVPGEPGRSIVLEGQPAATAVMRMRVREASAQPLLPAAGLALATETRFDSSGLHVRIQAGGQGELTLEARGAAAYDDKPILLFSGIQPIPPDGGGTWESSIDVLRPDEPWLQQATQAQDGRYIVYIKQANSQQEGFPIAKFSVRNGQVQDAEPVPLPLTGIDP